MKGQVIGKSMPHGYAGSYARQADMVVDTHPCEAVIDFGAPVVFGTAGAVKPWEEASTAAKFVGVAIREVKSATDYMNQDKSNYRIGEAVPIMKRGCVNVICQNGTPAVGGKVYIRTAKNSAYPKAVVGGFEAAEDTGKTVELTNAQWKGSADANGVAEMRILTILNA
nr:hypothetical protein [Lacrimispora amygdalina]